MARIDIRSNGGGGGSVATGVLQLENGVAMDSTLRNVADQNNTTSPLLLSTTAVQVESPLRITTSDASGFYLDAEDSATNNRFSIKRDPSAQEVTLDFASNPAGSTTLVGAIRTYQDGVNLSNAMSFIEDGSIGVGTNAPIGILHLKRTAATTRMVMDGDAGQGKIITYRTAGLQRFGLYVNNTAESGSNAGSDFAIRAYSDAGTLLSTALFIKRSTGNVGINTTTGTAKLQVVGSGSTSATTSLLVQNSSGLSSLQVNDAGSVFNLGGGSVVGNTAFGDSALIDNLTGANNTAIGKSALENNTAANNTAVGFEAALTNTNGTGITAIGYQALTASTGVNNTALGFQAGTAMTTSISSTAIGYRASFLLTTGNNNTSFGSQALYNNITGGGNVALGNNALFNNTASNNIAIGFNAALANTSGTGITAIGHQALNSSTGNNNTGLGFQALLSNTTGQSNTAVGVFALSGNTTGSNNTAVGNSTNSGNFTGSVILGSSATATGNNQFVVGTAAINAGAVTAEVNVSANVWNVVINGVARKILLA
jgi:hypothetical protein